MEIHTVVVGSGAAGLGVADRLLQSGVQDLALVTEKMNAGTSRNTGSDKQTYYKLSLSGEQEDSVGKMAQALYQGGCVDADTALCEAALSVRGFFRLVELGVPFPHDSCGQYVGYKTDHDPCQRGTSAGPYTSRYMTEALEKSVQSRNLLIYDNLQVIRIFTDAGQVYGILTMDTSNGEFTLIQCTNLIYATGGPAGIYADSVYPVSQSGTSGAAFAAGVNGRNLTEWQYGMASKSPRWNVSGSYMQALPRFVSTAADGSDEQDFLEQFYDKEQEMLYHIFLKGYQWPFDVEKVKNGSSILDLLVYEETCIRHRRVWLDFRNNPGKKKIAFSEQEPELQDYLQRTDAMQQTPYERLCRLNQPAADFYREHGVDLKKEKLEIAVCAQHNNGGLQVDTNWQTNIKGIFAVGEAAGTHGIYRPGGSALNAGQVGAIRAADYIAANREPRRFWNAGQQDRFFAEADALIGLGRRAAQQEEGTYPQLWVKAQKEMSRVAALIRKPEEIRRMQEEAGRELALMQKLFYLQMEEQDRGIAVQTEEKPCKKMSLFYRYLDSRITQTVYLGAMLDYLEHGGESRGSAIYEKKEGTLQIPDLVSYTNDQRRHAGEIQEIHYDEKTDRCQAFWRPVHAMEQLQQLKKPEAFEVVWKRCRDRAGGGTLNGK